MRVSKTVVIVGAACMLFLDGQRLGASPVLPRLERRTLTGIWEGVHNNAVAFRLDVREQGPAILVESYFHGLTTSVFTADEVLIHEGGRFELRGTWVTGGGEGWSHTMTGDGAADDRIGQLTLTHKNPNNYGPIRLVKTDGHLVEQLAQGARQAAQRIAELRSQGTNR